MIAIGYALTVADETARYSEFAKAIEGRKPFLCRERNNLLASGVSKYGFAVTSNAPTFCWASDLKAAFNS